MTSSYLSEWRAGSALLSNQATSSTRFAVGRDSERQQLKESITAFFERLDELEKISRQFPLNRQETELRDRLVTDTVGLVMPAYTNCYSRCSGKNLDKCE
jgi:hypothetical protein